MTVVKQSLLRAVVGSISEAIGDLVGKPTTRLRSTHAIGATVILVESTRRFPTAGSLYVGTEKRPITYTGVDQTAGAQRFTGCSPLVGAQIEGSEVLDNSQSYSALDQLWRALTITYSSGADLARVGRNMGWDWPYEVAEATWRSLLYILPYLPAGPIEALEIVLNAVFPLGGWSIYQDPVSESGVVHVTVPGQLGASEVGRTFIMDVDDMTSATALTANTTDEATLVESVVLQDVQVDLDMGALPSAAAPSWAYSAQTVGPEADYFSLAGGQLRHTTSVILGVGHSGLYTLTIPQIAQDRQRIEVYWRASVLASVNGYPWKLLIRDGEREYGLLWTDAALVLGQADETVVAAGVTFTAGTDWHHLALERGGDSVHAYLNGVEIYEEPAASFAAAPGVFTVAFGHTSVGLLNDWTVFWDNLRVYVHNTRNWWNLHREDGATAAGGDTIVSASAPFVAGDVGRLLKIDDYDISGSLVHGLWEIVAFLAANEVRLDGVLHTGTARFSSLTPTYFYSDDPVFEPYNVGKTIIVSGSTAGNDGPHVITSFVGSDTVICAASTFVSETGATWKFSAFFSVKAGLIFEVIAAGTAAATLLTWRDALPGATLPVHAEYTTVDSAQLVKDETVTIGTRKPYWLIGTDEWLQNLIRNIVPAGTVPKFFRTY